MLFFHALLLFLLSISAMGTARIRTIPTLPKPTLKLVQGPIPQSVRDKQDFEAYRGLWKTGTGDQSIMIFLDPVLQGVRKMYPESMDDDELKSVFTQPNTWQFVPYEEAQALENEKKLPSDFCHTLLRGIGTRKMVIHFSYDSTQAIFSLDPQINDRNLKFK